jgi:competence protein ComEA
MPDEAVKTKSNTKTILFFLAFGAITLGTLLWDWLAPEIRTSAVEISTAATSSETTAAQDTVSELIPIYLVGAVNCPGIYQVERGSYLYQLVDIAGGLTVEAATEQINLALKLDENQLIRLPTREEAAADPTAGLLVSAAAGSSPLVDINQAEIDELDGLPGIGSATARAIVEYRKSKGRFQQIEDLMKVPGIKESRFSALKNLICVRNRSS